MKNTRAFTVIVVALVLVIVGVLALMSKRALNQSDLAHRLGLSRAHMSEVMSGKRKLPRRARTMAHKLGVAAEVLIQ